MSPPSFNLKVRMYVGVKKLGQLGHARAGSPSGTRAARAPVPRYARHEMRAGRPGDAASRMRSGPYQAAPWAPRCGPRLISMRWRIRSILRGSRNPGDTSCGASLITRMTWKRTPVSRRREQTPRRTGAAVLGRISLRQTTKSPPESQSSSAGMAIPNPRQPRIASRIAVNRNKYRESARMR